MAYVKNNFREPAPIHTGIPTLSTVGLMLSHTPVAAKVRCHEDSTSQTSTVKAGIQVGSNHTFPAREW